MTRLTDEQWQHFDDVIDRLAPLPPDQRDAELRELGGEEAAVVAMTRLYFDLPAESTARDVTGEPEPIPGIELHQAIGEGSYGIVYEADQVHPVRRQVAVKILRVGLGSGEVLQRFEAERQALALMNHANIVRVLDAGSTQSGRPYFVMELIRGLPITEYCDRQRLTLNARLQLFHTLCRAVQHAHQKGVVHRDLKPSNVLVELRSESDQRGAGEDPQPKIIDFGVAKAIGVRLTEATIATQVGTPIGTPQYMSPEQAAGLEDIDTRSDVYSLGALLYEMLCGQPVFDSSDIGDIGLSGFIERIRTQEPSRPSERARLSAWGEPWAARRLRQTEWVRALRGELDWITTKAVAKERERRYDSVDALARDLIHVLRNEPTSAGPPDLSYRVRKFVRRHRGAVNVAAAGFIGLLLIVGQVSYYLATLPDIRLAESARTAAQVESDLEAAQLAFVSEDLAGCVVRCQHALAIDPDCLEAVCTMALVYQRHRRFEESIAVLDRHAATWPRESTLDRIRCESLMGLDRVDAAGAVRESLPALATPVDYFVQGYLELNNARKGDRRAARRALTCFTKAIHLSPAQRLIYLFGRAHAAGKCRAKGAAADCADMLETLWPQSAAGWFVVAFALAQVDSERALAAYERAVELDPSNYKAIANMGAVYCDLKRLPEAEQAIARALELHPASDVAYRTLSRILIDERRYDEAVTALGRAIDIAPRDPQTHADLGMLLEYRGHPDQAMASYRDAVRLGCRHASVFRNLAYLCAQRTQFEDAETFYRKGLEFDPKNAQLLGGLGYVLLNREHFDQAIAMLQRAIERKPREAKYRYILGLTYEGASKADEALNAYRACIECDARFDDARRELVSLLLSESQRAVDEQRLAPAVDMLREAHELKPTDAEINEQLATVQQRILQWQMDGARDPDEVK